MKILFITERFPWPLEDGGNLRTYHVLKALCQEHDVTLLSHAPQTSHDASVGELEKLCSVKIIKAPSKLALIARVASQPWKWAKSLFVLKNWSERLYRESQKLIEQREFDVVHFNHLDTAAFVTKHHWPKTVFDSHNCISTMALQLAGKPSSSWKRLLYRRESQALRAAEKAVCEQCDVVFACSEQDRNSFLQLAPSANVHVVPNGVETTALSQPSDRDSSHSGKSLVPRIVFTGAMDYSPNVAGVDWFCANVLPLVRKQRPNVLFQVVGRNPTEPVQKWNNLGMPQKDEDTFNQSERIGIEVTGRVDSVQPYLQNAAIVVVPLLDGGGTRLKILEAFAAKRAVVSTSKGAEGIEAIPGNDILIADDPECFANDILRLLNRPLEADQIGNAGHKLGHPTLRLENDRHANIENISRA